ncbi:TetR/AcrR family transcriptional regulator [Herbiconiux solani]|uniref:TetR/AcrR family transcriptional regulator n=1 Tax=Herbiconiux solani TaxID=661329 RepID=UPI0008257EE2|nr:helix-turn-helix domain-containing protein [Herbiconiux solani]
MSGSAPTPYHHGNLRTALLERAGETLAAEGADALTLRRLARELGVSHAAPGRHFRDRRALLDALALEGYAALNARLEASTDAAGPVDPHGASRFSAVARAYLGFAGEHGPLMEVMSRSVLSPSVSSPSVSSPSVSGSGTAEADGADAAARLAAARRRGLELTASSMREDSGPVDPRRGLIAFALIHGLAQLAAEDLLEGHPLDDLVDLAVDTVWRGLETDAGRGTKADGDSGVDA